ncbi:hypothetical protein [Streptomyces altiplanensis]
MTTESTSTTSTAYAPHRWEHITLADQRAAFTLGVRLTELYPGIPAAFITLSYVTPRLVEVQAMDFSALEAWRAALGVPALEVVEGNCAPQRQHLEFGAEVDGVRVRVYAMGDLVSQVSA